LKLLEQALCAKTHSDTTTQNTKRLAAVVHDVVMHERFATAADLKEAVKQRCARLRLPYDSGTLAAALDLVERTRRTVSAP